MQILHQTGHRGTWAFEMLFENKVGDGFVLCASSYESDKIATKMHGYKPEQYLDKTFLDLQYYGKRENVLPKLQTYPFHPVKLTSDDETTVQGFESIYSGIKYQEDNGFTKIIIPIFYEEDRSCVKFKRAINKINDYLIKNKNDQLKYYMTICLNKNDTIDQKYIESILIDATDINIIFDGYYIVAESNIGYKQKLTTDINYYENILTILKTLKLQGFETILGYANWNAILFASLCDIDYVTIGIYENLRNFSLGRFTEEIDGGASKGWYFSEKLLNVIKADLIPLIRNNNKLSLIRNDNNIFSDIILKEDYKWSIHRKEVSMNNLLAMYKLYDELRSISKLKDRTNFLVNKINNAQQIYRTLHENGVLLTDESKDYFLGLWLSFLNGKV